MLATIAAAALIGAARAAYGVDEQRIDDLVLAGRILADQDVMDAFGHVSVRSASHPGHYFMARSCSPALVTRADVLEFDADGRPVQPLPAGWRLFGEQAIHTALYRARPDVQAVVHAHAPDILPFAVAHVSFRAAIHQASFLGATPVPLYDSRGVPGYSDQLLVTSVAQGAALAGALGDRSMVLMRGHGFSLVGPSVRGAVFEAIYAVQNARTLLKAAPLGRVNYLGAAEVARMPDGTAEEILARPWQAWTARIRPSAAPEP